MRFQRIAAVAASAVGASLVVISTSFGDIVNLTPDATTKGTGGAVRGQVQSESPTTVEVKLGNTVTKVPTNEVESITYDGQPASLTQGFDKESSNDLTAAADLFKKAATEASTKPFVAEEALFQQARVTAEMAISDPSRAADAIALLDSFTRAHKTGRHVAPALESLAKLQLAQGDYAGVEKTLAQFGQFPKG